MLSLGKFAAAADEFAQALDYFEQAERSTQNPTEQLQAKLSQFPTRKNAMKTYFEIG